MSFATKVSVQLGFLELCTYLVKPMKIISGSFFFPGTMHRLCRTMKTVHLFVETGRKATKVGGWL